MAAKGQPKSGGRTKGTPNKNTQDLMAKCLELGVQPFEILLNFAKGDWMALGLPMIKFTDEKGRELEREPEIKQDMRLMAAREAAQYLYPKRKAIEHTHDIDPELLKEAEQLAKLDRDTLEQEVSKELKLIKGKKA